MCIVLWLEEKVYMLPIGKKKTNTNTLFFNRFAVSQFS